MISQKIAISLVAVVLFVGSMTAHAADYGAGVKAYNRRTTPLSYLWNIPPPYRWGWAVSRNLLVQAGNKPCLAPLATLPHNLIVTFSGINE